MEQYLGLENKANVHIPLAIAGAQPFWILMSVECEPCQSLDYAVHSLFHSSAFINVSLKPEIIEAGYETLQSLPKDLDGIYGRGTK